MKLKIFKTFLNVNNYYQNLKILHWNNGVHRLRNVFDFIEFQYTFNGH